MSTAKKASSEALQASHSASLLETPIFHSADHLANQFLIAMPSMVDPNFSGSVIYLFEHTERGAMGLVINRPADLNLSELFEKIEIKLDIPLLLNQSVYFGGPVQIERGFVLHEPVAEVTYNSSLNIPHGLAMTTSKDILEAIATGGGPSKFLMTLGYAGWGAGQLEEEITLNDWMNVPLTRKQMIDIIFDTAPGQRYERTMNHLGFDPTALSGEVGHA